MTSLSPELHRDIRQTLLDCGSFNDSNYLRDLFTDGRISPWRYSLPSRDNVIALVEAYIAFLVGKNRADNGKNALALFMLVLSERHDPAVECHHNLLNMVADLEAELQGEKRPSLQKPTTTSQQTEPTPTTETSSRRRSRRRGDNYTYYEKGLQKLVAALKAEENDEEFQDAYRDALLFQSQLLENLSESKRSGTTPDLKAERSRIILNLNELALDMLDKSFNQICDEV